MFYEQATLTLKIAVKKKKQRKSVMQANSIEGTSDISIAINLAEVLVSDLFFLS